MLQDDRRLQDGWALSPGFKATIPQGGKLETLLMGRRHWNRRTIERPSLITPRGPVAEWVGLPCWPAVVPRGGAAKL